MGFVDWYVGDVVSFIVESSQLSPISEVSKITVLEKNIKKKVKVKEHIVNKFTSYIMVVSKLKLDT